MPQTKGISPKLAAAIAPPLAAIASAAILTSTLDKQNAALLASVVIGALLGYHAPAGTPKTVELEPAVFGPSIGHVTLKTTDGMAGTMGHNKPGSPERNELDAKVAADRAAQNDDGDDGDDQLPAELVNRTTANAFPPDEVDQPEQTQLKNGGAA